MPSRMRIAGRILDPMSGFTKVSHASTWPPLRSQGRLRSRRAATDLRELARHAARHKRTDGVTDLRHHIRQTVAAL